MTRVYQPVAGGAGSGLHADLTDVSANQHHAKLHATDHLAAGADAITNIGQLHANTLDHSNVLDHSNALDHTRSHAVDAASDHTAGTLGDLLYAAVAGAWARLAGNTTATKKFLTQTGTGIVSAAPVWDVLVAGDIPTLTHASLSGVTADQHHTQAHHAAHEPSGADPMAVDAAAATGSLRTLGSGAAQAVSGTDSRLSDARTPTAHASTHAPSGADPLLVASGSYTPGSMTVPDGTWMLVVDKHKLTSTQSLIARGTAVVRGIGTTK